MRFIIRTSFERGRPVLNPFLLDLEVGSRLETNTGVIKKTSASPGFELPRADRKWAEPERDSGKTARGVGLLIMD